MSYWGGNGNTRDAAGSNHGRAYGGLTYVEGKEGKAFSFDGRDDQVMIPNNSSIQITGSMTLAFWMKPARLQIRQNPVCKSYGGEFAVTLEPDGRITSYHGQSGQNYDPYLGLTSKGRVSLHVNRRGSNPKPLEATEKKILAPKGQWTHVAIVRDATKKTAAMYVNGKLAVKARDPFSPARASSMPMFIGNGYASRFHGLIDDVGLWKRALTMVEIRGLCGGGAGYPEIQLDRERHGDVVVLANGDRLVGKLLLKQMTMETEFGEVSLSDDQIVGFTPSGTDAGRLRVLLSDGQIVTGKTDRKTLRFLFSGTNHLEVPLQGVSSVAYGISRDKPSQPMLDKPHVLLRDESVLAVDRILSSMVAETAIGKLDLKQMSLRSITLDYRTRASIRTSYGSHLLGRLQEKKFSLRLGLGAEYAPPADEVLSIVWPGRERDPENHALFTLRDGSLVKAVWKQEDVSVKTEFGKASVFPGLLMNMDFGSDRGAVTVATTAWDNTSLRGTLVEQSLALQIPSTDKKLSVASSEVVSVTRELPQAPPGIRKRIDKLISQLGSAEYELREQAMEDLENMDMLALWHLQRAAESRDTEIRLRCRYLLRKIRNSSR